MCETIFGLLAIKELFHYYDFKKLEKFVSLKKYHHNPTVDSQWYENYMLTLTPQELQVWLKNSINKNVPSHDSYYHPLELYEIPRKKVIKWVAYHIYYQSMWQLSKNQIDHAESILVQLESKLQIKFPDTENSSIYFLKFGNNLIESEYRPRILITFLDVLKQICYLALYLLNFDKWTYRGNLIYFTYSSPENEGRWTIFVHGLGFGIQPYLYYILRLRKKTNLVILILPNISNMEYSTSFGDLAYDKIFPEYATWRSMIKFITLKHNIDKFNLIGHSFGTIILSLLLQDPWIVNKTKKKVLVEPVCFYEKSWKIYRYINEPQSGSYNFIASIFNFVIYKNIFLRYVTQRFLYGPEFWFHDKPTDYQKLTGSTLIILSEMDQVVPSQDLLEIFKRHNVDYIYLNNAYHSDMFMSDEHSQILDYMDDFLFRKIENISI